MPRLMRAFRKRHYLVAMATFLEKLENKVQIHHLQRRALSYGEKIAKIGPVCPEIFD